MDVITGEPLYGMKIASPKPGCTNTSTDTSTDTSIGAANAAVALQNVINDRLLAVRPHARTEEKRTVAALNLNWRFYSREIELSAASGRDRTRGGCAGVEGGEGPRQESKASCRYKERRQTAEFRPQLDCTTTGAMRPAATAPTTRGHWQIDPLQGTFKIAMERFPRR